MIKAPAFGGGFLHRSKLVRIAYLDETGLSSMEQEPYTVVAGLLLNGDEEMIRLEKNLAEIVAQFPENHEEKRFIHTAQMYGGYGAFKDRNGWNRDLRFRLLDEVANLVASIEGPVVYGFYKRAQMHPENSGFSRLNLKHPMSERPLIAPF